MTLTTAQQVRLRIQDIPQIADVVQTFDGTADTYQLQNGAIPYRNVTSATAFVPVGGTAWSATAATFNPSGFVTFGGVGSAQSAWRWRGVYSVFSDEEIDHFTAVGGTVAGAALEAVQVLMFDALKRASWRAPDGTEYDDTKAMDMLRTLYATLKEEIADAQVGDGAFVSWAEGQADW